MKYVPNALSLSRIPLAVALFVFAINEHWGWAAACMMAALITDGLDGAIARYYHIESEFGGKILEPFCDLALLIGAVAGLCLGGYWPTWVLLVAMVAQLLLELSHRTPFTWLKRHTFYIHPFAFVAVVFVAGYALLLAAYDGDGSLAGMAYVFTWAAVATEKKDRWMVWLRGPQPAAQPE